MGNIEPELTLVEHEKAGFQVKKIGNFVWDTVAMEWVRMVGTASGEVNVEANISYSGVPVASLIFAESTSVSDNTLTTIASITPVAATSISNIMCSGEDTAKFQVFIDTVVKITKRGSGSDLNVDFTFAVPFQLDAGATMEVKVIHFNTGETLDYEAAILGYTT